MFSDFKLGRFAGGGMRRAVATFPRLCKPCLGITAGREGWEQRRTGTSRRERPGPCGCVSHWPVATRPRQKPGSPLRTPTSGVCDHLSHSPSPPPRPAGHRRGRVSAEAPLLPGARGGLRELTTWVRTQARAPPAHMATSLETEQLWPHYGRTEGQPLPRPRPGLSGAPPPTKPPRGADGASRSFPTTFQNTGATKSQPGNSSLPIGLKIPTASVR